MPIYEFRCTACDDRFEVERPMGKITGVVCPSCSSEAKRVFSASAVVFKGTGFHNTDYKPRPKEEGAAPSASETAPATKAPSTEIKKKPKELSPKPASE